MRIDKLIYLVLVGLLLLMLCLSAFSCKVVQKCNCPCKAQFYTEGLNHPVIRLDSGVVFHPLGLYDSVLLGLPPKPTSQ